MIAQSPTCHFRVFPIDPTGRVVGVATVIEASDDEEAVQAAKLLLRGRTGVVWSGSRLVDTVNCRGEVATSQSGVSWVL